MKLTHGSKTDRGHTWEDHDADPEQGGEVTWEDPATDDGMSRRLDLARQMVAWLAANQDPSYKITGKVWSRRGLVRVYTSVGSYAEITETEEGYTYKHIGVDRGSHLALADAWDAAE